MNTEASHGINQRFPESNYYYSEQVGIARVKEALESNDWAAEEVSGLDDFEDLIDSPTGDEDGLNLEGQEMGLEFAALKSALTGDTSATPDENEPENEQVDELDRMMAHLQAARGEKSALPFRLMLISL